MPEGAAFPIVPGSDGAGTVIAAGSQVNGLAVGDLVYVSATARPKGGFYAEYAAVKAQYAAKLPDGIPVEHAGAMPTDALTALAGLDTLSLSAGDWLLIFGASGGQGHLAVQLAKRQGLNVIAVASGADGVALVTRLGADVSLDGHGDVTEVLARIRDAAPDGVAGHPGDGRRQDAGPAHRGAVPTAVWSRTPTVCSRNRRAARRDGPGVRRRGEPRAVAAPQRAHRGGTVRGARRREVPAGQGGEAHRRLQTSYPGKLLLTVG